MIQIDQTLIIQIVNFIIFLFIVNYLIFKPIVRVIDERRERIEGTTGKARLMEAEFQKKLQDYEGRIQEAKAQAASEKDTLRRQGESLSKEIVEKARTELARDIPIIRRQIATETDQARRKLEKMAQDMAKDIARQILGREI
jgi:F-type H+-transporting ATPase subunit b